MDYSSENIEKAVQQFYQDGSSQQEINKWLMSAQLSNEAWSFPWILLDKSKPPEVQFFGASTLHVKISKFWEELNNEQVISLRSQLLDQIVQHAAGPRMVLTRLCVALSSLVLQSCHDLWPDAVSSIISTFQHQNLPHLQAVEVCMLLVDILTILPEEFYATYVQNQRKGIVRNELKKGVQEVLALIERLLSLETNHPAYEQSLKCFCSWVQFGISLPEIEHIVCTVFGLLSNTVLFDTAIETLVQVFSLNENFHFPTSIERLLPYVLGIQPLWQQAAQQQDMDTLQGLTKLIVTVSDQNTKIILLYSRGSPEQQHLALSLVNMVLMCTSVPGHYPVDECCSDLPFGFWYNLQDEVVASDREVYLALVPVFCPVYMSLVNILLQKVQYPSEVEYDSWNSEEKESHRCYRQDISDTLMYAYSFLHEPLLGNLCHLLAQVVQNSANEEIRWQKIEAVLFAVSSVAESVEVEECVYLPNLFKSLARVPFNHQKLISTALYLIGAYAEWISSHPEVLSSVVPLLLQGITNSQLAQPATLALKDVLRENQEHIKPYVTDILAATQQVLDSGQLKPRDVVRLMSCLGYALSVCPVPQIMQYLNLLLAPHMEQLSHLAQQDISPLHKATIQLKLNMLSWLFTSLNINWDKDEQAEAQKDEKGDKEMNQPQPILLILEQFLPLLHTKLHKYLNDPSIIECVCDMLKRAVKTLLSESSSLYNNLAHLMMQMYSVCPNHSILDLAKQLLVLFANDDKHKALSKSLFSSLCVQTLSLFENGSIKDHPDLLETFMSFLSQIAKKNNSLLIEDVPYSGLFQAGIIGMSMAEVPTVKCSCQFLVEFLSLSERIAEIANVVKSQSLTLVDALMRAIGGDSPRSVVDTMGDVFLALNKHQFPVFRDCMESVVQRENFPNARTTKEQKEQFAKRLFRQRSNKRIVKTIVQEYTLLWRGLIGTEYAAQTQRLLDTN